MRKIFWFLSGFFIFVTLSRVSAFSASLGDLAISIAFALGLGVTIFGASYWTQYRGNSNPAAAEIAKVQQANRWAWVVLVVAVAIDGIFNLADVMSAHPANFYTVTYGLTPTAIVLLLGVLQAKLDVLPVLRAGTGYQVNLALRKALTRFLEGLTQKQTVAEMQSELKQLQGKISAGKGLQKELKGLQKQNTALQTELAALQGEHDSLQASFETVAVAEKLVQTLPLKLQAAAMYKSGTCQTLQEAAKFGDCDASTVSRLAKTLNGSKPR